jgi:hypothetical protein
LYLHRSYALLRELDQQVTGKLARLDLGLGSSVHTFFCLGNYDQIHPTLQEYILLRRSLMGQGQPDPKPNGVVVKEQSPASESEVKLASDSPGDSKPSPEFTEAQSGECAPPSPPPPRLSFLHHAIPVLSVPTSRIQIQQHQAPVASSYGI